MNQRPRSTDKRSFYRGSKSGSRSRERRFSTTNFKPRSNSRSREHEAGSSLKNEVKEMNSKVESQGKKLDKIEKLLERMMANDRSTMDSSVTGFITKVSAEDNKIPSDVFWIKSEKKSILLDCGAPKGCIGKAWINEYKMERSLKDEDLNYKPTEERF